MSCIDVSLQNISIAPTISTTNVGVGASFTLTVVDGGGIAFTAQDIRESGQISVTSCTCALFSVSNLVEKLSLVFTMVSSKMEFALVKTCAVGEFISCFGRGIWKNGYPWLNNEAWNNNNP